MNAAQHSPADLEAAFLADSKVDHHLLAQLIESVSNLCGQPASRDCQCEACPKSSAARCREALVELSSRMQALMLAHFERENATMSTLSRAPAAQRHCEQHRREHVDFSTRYNRTIAGLHGISPARGARAFEAFVVEWTRDHALEYDAKLAELAAAPTPMPR